MLLQEHAFSIKASILTLFSRCWRNLWRENCVDESGFRTSNNFQLEIAKGGLQHRV